MQRLLAPLALPKPDREEGGADPDVAQEELRVCAICMTQCLLMHLTSNISLLHA
jgi:hypothetical protein